MHKIKRSTLVIYPQIEEGHGFGRTYNVIENAKIMYYVVETYEDVVTERFTYRIIKEMNAKTEPELKEAEVQAYTEFLQQEYPLFKSGRNVRLIRVLLAIVDLRIAQEALLDNHESLKGKQAFDSLILTSHIFDGGQVAINCANRALDRMAFEVKNFDTQKDLLGFEDATNLVLRYLYRLSEDLKQDIRYTDQTRRVRLACRDNMLRLNRATTWLLNVYHNIEEEIDG